MVIVTYYHLNANLTPGTVVPPHVVPLVTEHPGSRRNVVGVAVDSLNQLGVQCDSFASREYPRDTRDGVHALVERLTAGGAAHVTGMGMGITLCLWWDHSFWHTEHVLEVMARAGPRQRIVHAVFNWDPTRGPTFQLPEDRRGLWPLVFVSDEGVPPVYTTQVRFLPPPVNTHVFRPLQVQHEWVASFACTNYYTGLPNQCISRYEAVCALSAALGPRFAFFGTFSTGKTDPHVCASFLGEVGYADLPYVASASKVCLCLSADMSVYKYMNERMVIMAACGANILCDPVAGFREYFGDTVLYLDPALPFLPQVLEAAEACEARRPQREQLRELAKRRFDGLVWANTVLEETATYVLHADNELST